MPIRSVLPNQSPPRSGSPAGSSSAMTRRVLRSTSMAIRRLSPPSRMTSRPSDDQSGVTAVGVSGSSVDWEASSRRTQTPPSRPPRVISVHAGYCPSGDTDTSAFWPRLASKVNRTGRPSAAERCDGASSHPAPNPMPAATSIAPVAAHHVTRRQGGAWRPGAAVSVPELEKRASSASPTSRADWNRSAAFFSRQSAQSVRAQSARSAPDRARAARR